jgi:hypothetical protein
MKLREDHMGWLRGSKRDQTERLESENVLNFSPALLSSEGPKVKEPLESYKDPARQSDPTPAFDLLHQLAEVIREKDDRATEIEARANALAQCAVDELQRADARLRFAETARRAAEAAVNEASARIENLEGKIESLQSRIATAEADLLSATCARQKWRLVLPQLKMR